MQHWEANDSTGGGGGGGRSCRQDQALVHLARGFISLEAVGGLLQAAVSGLECLGQHPIRAIGG